MSLDDLFLRIKAFYGHRGRPGQHGGSLPKSGGSVSINSVREGDTIFFSRGKNKEILYSGTVSYVDRETDTIMVNVYKGKSKGIEQNIPIKPHEIDVHRPG